ncbi:MAG: response regulator, partial [Proteobacteria bacterium]|nr:response regulator [Pseudomonadota bacterium]
RVAGEQARAASSKIWTIAAGELDRLLQQRIEAFERKRNVSLLVAACAFVAAISFVSFITRSISGPLQRQTAALTAANEAMHREIAERDRVEAALRRSQADLEAAQAAALTMMADVQESRRKTELAYADLQHEVAGRQQAEAQFLQSQKLEAIGQLAGGIAHDFNNIVAAMLMQSDLITDPVSTPAEVQEGVREIQAGARRAANLTRQLLLFSRKQVMQAKELDLNDVVASLSKMLQRIIGEDVRLEFHPHPVALAIHADAGMLDQVLLNLAVNARDAMPNGGRVRIETGEQILDVTLARQQPDGVPGRYVWLSVSDTGTGIPPEVLPRIFEPFYTTKEAGKGSGLGLATVFGIVKQHQGWVRVASEYGHGATFTIYLPASTSRSVNPDLAVVPPKPRGGTETILLVEDEPGVRMITRTLLVRHGYRVVEAESGLAALKIWPSCRDQAALLLTDLVMPEGVSGQQLAARLQTDRPRLKVIFMSGYSADIAGQDLHLQSGQNFLQKPFASHLLLETVRRALDG